MTIIYWLLSVTCVALGTILAVGTGHVEMLLTIGIPAFIRSFKKGGWDDIT